MSELDAVVASLKGMILVREGTVIDEEVALERANNMAVYVLDLVDRTRCGEAHEDLDSPPDLEVSAPT